jgi:hypothetical protein
VSFVFASSSSDEDENLDGYPPSPVLFSELLLDQPDETGISIISIFGHKNDKKIKALTF